MKYRVDTFSDAGHEKTVYETETEARQAAEKAKKAGKIVFLLQEVIDNLYDVLEEI